MKIEEAETTWKMTVGEMEERVVRERENLEKEMEERLKLSAETVSVELGENLQGRLEQV